jgi:malate dehydrogenase
VLLLLLLLQILVIANPANTNALMLKEHAPSIPAENITALTRLDHNRALAQVSHSVDLSTRSTNKMVVHRRCMHAVQCLHASTTTGHRHRCVAELVFENSKVGCGA